MTTDLGDEPSLDQLLLRRSDTDRAVSGLTVMARTIGRLHAAAGRVLPLWPDRVHGLSEPWWRSVPTVLAEYGFAAMVVPEADIAELTRLSVEPKWCVLAYGAVMPGKVIVGPVEGKLFDFQQAASMHLGWDAAAFRLSFPASEMWWGVLPDEVIAAMERSYRVEAAQGIPEIEDDSVFRRLLAAG